MRCPGTAISGSRTRWWPGSRGGSGGIDDMALDLNPSASETILEAAIRSLGVDLPLDYKDFLRASNGGAGFVGDTYLHLWKAEELKPLNDGYQVARFAPALLLIGSDGGGEAY